LTEERVKNSYNEHGCQPGLDVTCRDREVLTELSQDEQHE